MQTKKVFYFVIVLIIGCISKTRLLTICLPFKAVRISLISLDLESKIRQSQRIITMMTNLLCSAEQVPCFNVETYVLIFIIYFMCN